MPVRRLTILWGLTLWTLLASARAAEAAEELPRERGTPTRQGTFQPESRPRAGAPPSFSESAAVLPEFRVSGPSAVEFVARLNAACRKHLGAAAPRLELAPGLDAATGPDRLGFADLEALFLDCTPEQIVRLACTSLDLPWGAAPGRLIVGSGTSDTREQCFQLSPRFFEHYAAAGDAALKDFLQARALVLPPTATVALNRAKSELIVTAEPDAIATTATWLRVLGYGGGPHEVQVRLCLGTFATLQDLDTARVTPWDESETLATVSFGPGEVRKNVSIGTATERLDVALSCTYTNPRSPIGLAWEGRLSRDRSEFTWTGSTTLFAGQVTAFALPAVAAADGATPATMLRLRVDLAWPTAGLDDGPPPEVGSEKHPVLEGLPGVDRLIPKVVYADTTLETALWDLLRQQWPDRATRPPLALIGLRRSPSRLAAGAPAGAEMDPKHGIPEDAPAAPRAAADEVDYDPVPQRPVTFDLDHVSLCDCLDYMGKLTRTNPTYGQGVLAMVDQRMPLTTLHLGVFRAEPGILPGILDRRWGRPRPGARRTDEPQLPAWTPAEVALLDRKASGFFRNMGLTWPRGSALHYDPELGVLLVHSISSELRKVQSIVSVISDSAITAALTARVVRVTSADLDRALAERTAQPASISELWRTGAQDDFQTLALCETICQTGSGEGPPGRAGVTLDGQPRLDFEGSVRVASDRYSVDAKWRLRFGVLDLAGSALLSDGTTVALRLPPRAGVPTPQGTPWLLLRLSLLRNGPRQQSSRVTDPADSARADVLPPEPVTSAATLEAVALPLVTGSRFDIASRLDELLPAALRAAVSSEPASKPALVRLARCPAAQAQEVRRFLRGPLDEEPADSESGSAGRAGFLGGFGEPEPPAPHEMPATAERPAEGFAGFGEAQPPTAQGMPATGEKPAAGATFVTRSYSACYPVMFRVTPYTRLHACLPGETWRPAAHLDRHIAGNRYVRPVRDRCGDNAPGDDDDDDDAVGSRVGEPFVERFFDAPEPVPGAEGDSHDWGFEYGLSVTESLRTVAGLEMPPGSRGWMNSRSGTLRVHSTPWDHGRLARCLDAMAYPDGPYLLEIRDAGAPQPGCRLDAVAIRGEPFSVPLPSPGQPGAASPLQLHGQLAEGMNPIQGLLGYRIERPAPGDKPAEVVAQGSILLTVGVPAELSLPGPEPRTFALNLIGLRPDGTRRPWPVLADTLAEQRAAQAAPFARALRECRLPALAVNGLSVGAALRRLIEAWEAAPGAPPCNLVALLEYGTPGPLVGDWPAQSLAEALARFCAERKLPLEIAGDAVFIGYGPVPSDSGLMLLPCPPDRLPVPSSGKKAASTPAVVGHLRRLIYAEPIDFGPCDKAWYLPGEECIYARGRLDFRLRLAGIVERCLLPPAAEPAR